MQEINSKFISGGKFIKDYAGHSEEENPSSEQLATGSSIFEVNTGRGYFFHATSGKWYNPRTGNERGSDD